MDKAINEKNETYAVLTATRSRGMFGPDYNAGAKEYEMRMLEYYRQTKDTAKYLKNAIGYFERFLMSLNTDTIKIKDSVYKARALAQNLRKDTVFIKGSPTISSFVMLHPMGMRYAGELNNGAWHFYKMTREPFLISLAIEWVKKALELNQSPEILDTYAHLLYLQKKKAEAIEAESKAIALTTKAGYSTKSFEEVLAKMKQNAVKLD